LLRYSKLFVNSVLVLTTPLVALFPQNHTPQITFQVQKVNLEEKQLAKDYIPSYDEILRLLDEIESGELEKKCTSKQQIKNLAHFVALLAKEGILPDNSPESLSLDDDIEELLNEEDNLYEGALSFVTPSENRMIIPAVLYGKGEIVHCKSWAQKQWKHVKKFTKKHKKALIIGSAVVVATSVVVVAVVAASSATAVGVAGVATGGIEAAAAASNNERNKKNQKEASSTTNPIPTNDSPRMAANQEAPTLRSALDDQTYSFKENIVKNQFFQPTNPKIGQQGLSWEENARVLGSIFAHDSYNNIQNQIPYHPRLAQEVDKINSKYSFPILGGYQGISTGHPEIDRKFSTNYTSLYSNPDQEIDFNTLSHQVRGEKALACGYYNQAVQDLGKAIETNPTNPVLYIKRGIAHFGLEEYERSLEDYNQFTAQTPKTNLLPIVEFSLGVAKGLPRGIYESGKGLLTFFAEFIKHPIQTSRQLFDTGAELAKLVKEDQWGIIAEALAPELCQVVTEWDTLPYEKRGELIAYTVGKYGTDLLAPGTITKLATKSTKSAQELAIVCQNLQIAQDTLVLETALGIGNISKVTEVIRNGQTMAFLGEELGFTAQEIAQLKQAGKLEGAINSGLEKLVSQSESEVFKAAVNQNRHVKMVRDYLDKPTKEVQKGINSYERQIAIHKDKISNPTKHYPNWDKLDPRQREALINKKWPAEIQNYEDQRNVLQSILNERFSHE
jgi:tetratricopeptide (TPR) repeat protein